MTLEKQPKGKLLADQSHCSPCENPRPLGTLFWAQEGGGDQEQPVCLTNLIAFYSKMTGFVDEEEQRILFTLTFAMLSSLFTVLYSY